MEAQIQYPGFWGHKPFGTVEGAALTFNIARSCLEQDGSFEVYLPNLRAGDEFSSPWEDASFLVLVTDAGSRNVWAELKPPTSLSRAGNLKIIPSDPQTMECDSDWRAVNSLN
jgi:hypothetical protein